MKLTKFVLLCAAAAFVLVAGCGQKTDIDSSTADRQQEAEPIQSALVARALRIAAPIVEQRPVTIYQLGRTRVDEYAWLRDESWQDVLADPSVLRADIRGHLENENAYVQAVMAPTEALQERLYQEMRGRIQEDDATVPAPDGIFAYFTRYREGGQYPIYVRSAVDAESRELIGVEQILLDGDTEAEGIAYFRLRDVRHSPDHRYLAYAVDVRGSEYYEIRIRDLATGQAFPTLTGEGTGEFVWANDSNTLFWVWLDGNGHSKRVYRQAVNQAEATLIYEEADDGFFVSVFKSEGHGYIGIEAGGHTSNELRLIDAHAPEGDPVLVAPRAPDTMYYLIEASDRFYFRTNADGAVDFKIVSASLDAPGRESWTDVVPHRPGILIGPATGFRDWLVRMEIENALPRIVVREYATGQEHEIAFEEEAYALELQPGYEFAVDTLRFTYQSPTTPPEVYDYDMRTRDRVLRKRQEVPSGHDSESYVCRRIMAPAHDGQEIPVTVLYRAGTPLDGSAALLLYGYGSYGSSVPAGFSISRLSLVDRGMIYAMAHVRGGMECGYGWYLDGKREHKGNTFRDFISAGEALADEGFTSRGRIVAYGGSAGGLLVGAAINMAPDMFVGAIGAVPFVDVLNTMSDASLPLTAPEWPEWGNPIENETDYDTIADYSPYDNIGAHAYPHVLATAGLTDIRVTYWEPAKWVARLRATRTDGGLTLLRTNMGAGHGGASGRFDYLRELAHDFTFALMTAGLADAEVDGLPEEP